MGTWFRSFASFIVPGFLRGAVFSYLVSLRTCYFIGSDWAVGLLFFRFGRMLSMWSACEESASVVSCTAVNGHVRAEQRRQGVARRGLTRRINVSIICLSGVRGNHMCPALRALSGVYARLSARLTRVLAGARVTHGSCTGSHIIRLFGSYSVHIGPVTLTLLRSLSGLWPAHGGSPPQRRRSFRNKSSTFLFYLLALPHSTVLLR